jgi:cytochrome c biogenesis protein CcdA
MRGLRTTAILAALVALGVSAAAEDRKLTFDPPEWRYGEVRYDAQLSLSVEVAYTGPGTADVSFIPTCDCIQASPQSLAIQGGGKASVKLSFDPREYDGPTQIDFIVRTNVPGMEKALFSLSGVVKGKPQSAGASTSPRVAGQAEALHLAYYYSPGCAACERFLGTEVPRLEQDFGMPMVVDRRNVFDSSVFEEYTALVKELGVVQGDLPALLVGRTLLQGDREIRDGVELEIRALLDARAAGSAQGQERAGSASQAPVVRELRLLPVVAAGLLDGVNPCAFTTLVFLISALAVAGRGRREVLIIGGCFTASVFASYFAIGLGAFGALRVASGFPIVALVLKWVLFAVLVVFAGLSVYDYTVIRRGDPTRILLQLPTALKQRIHTSIRAGARSAAMTASAVVMGILVSVFELACTGQVYFPTIAYLVRARAGATSYLYLLLYNLGFIAPLAVVFVLTFFGLTSARLGQVMRKSMGGVKLALAALFLALAALTVVM